MKYKKKILYIPQIISFILVFMSIISLSGCSYSGSGDNSPSGTKGLVMNIMENSIPTRIYENEPLYLQLRLKNEGSHDIRNGVLDVTVDQYSFSIENKEQFRTIELQGDSGNFEGEEKVQDIKLQSKEFAMEGTNAHDASIKINACYEYETFFQDVLCIDTDVRDIQAGKPCHTKAISGSRGQGAPVVVERVDPRISMGTNGARLTFDIYIKNSGSGTLLSEGAYERVCTSDFTSEDFDRVKIKEIEISTYALSDGDIRCTSHVSDEFNIFDIHSETKDSINCEVVEEIPYSLGTYSTPIAITLSYGYLQSTQTSLKIEKR